MRQPQDMAFITPATPAWRTICGYFVAGVITYRRPLRPKHRTSSSSRWRQAGRAGLTVVPFRTGWIVLQNAIMPAAGYTTIRICCRRPAGITTTTAGTTSCTISSPAAFITCVFAALRQDRERRLKGKRIRNKSTGEKERLEPRQMAKVRFVRSPRAERLT